MAALKVVFLAPVSYGFKHDTKGHEATLDADGKKVLTEQAFAPGDEFTVPEAEREGFEALIEFGAAREA